MMMASELYATTACWYMIWTSTHKTKSDGSVSPAERCWQVHRLVQTSGSIALCLNQLRTRPMIPSNPSDLKRQTTFEFCTASGTNQSTQRGSHQKHIQGLRVDSGT